MSNFRFPSQQRFLFSRLSPTGSESPVRKSNVVQWAHNVGDAVTHNMGYRDGRLLVEKAGYYYLYSKLTLSDALCSLIQHKVMKVTQAYDQPIELMKAKRFVSVPLLISFLFCRTRTRCPVFQCNLFCIFTCVSVAS